MVAAAGVLVSMFLTFSASSGVIFTMKALMVVVMGGVGNLLGCLVAGLALGLSESLVATFVDPGLTLAVNFALFLGVLLVKPAGLFGQGAAMSPAHIAAAHRHAAPAWSCWRCCRATPMPIISRSRSACCNSPCSPPHGDCSPGRPATCRWRPRRSSASAPIPWRCSAKCWHGRWCC